jgi:hypothetical protein
VTGRGGLQITLTAGAVSFSAAAAFFVVVVGAATFLGAAGFFRAGLG